MERKLLWDYLEETDWVDETECIDRPNSFPYPIIFARLSSEVKYPKLQMKSLKNKQIFYSSSNFNLFLDCQIKPDSKLRDLEGTFTLGDFMIALNEHPSAFGALTSWKYNLLPQYSGDDCYRCQKANQVPCALFLKPLSELNNQNSTGLTFEAKLLSQIAEASDSGKAVDMCTIMQFMLNLTETAYERKFLKDYYVYVINYIKGVFAWRKREDHKKWLTKQFKQCMKAGKDASNYFAKDCISALDLPALIPQAYINIVDWQTNQTTNPNTTFYKENISRVDFIMLNKGEKHIVEIDGLSHYSSDSAYTRNLIIERKLRKAGWHMHRFSNGEVREALDFNFAADELDLPHLDIRFPD